MGEAKGKSVSRWFGQCRRCLTMKNIQVGVDVCDRCLAHPAEDEDQFDALATDVFGRLGADDAG